MNANEPDDIYREIQGVREANGWRAIFVEKHEHGFPYLAEEPIIGWATVAIHGVYIDREADVVVDIEISGLVAREAVEEAGLSPNFMGYIGPGEDRNVYLDDIPVRLTEIEADETAEIAGTPEVPDSP